MIDVSKHGIVLSKTTLDFEAESVLNPAVIKVGKSIHMFYRAVAIGNFSSIGYCKLSAPMVVEHRDENPLIYPEFD